MKRYGIDYFLCNKCGHLNGDYQDFENFSNQIYLSQEDKTDYAYKFLEEDVAKYNERSSNIYLPKAQFLLDSLTKENLINPKIADFGCGAGHFVKSLQDLKISNVKGYEVSKSQVEYANKITNSNNYIFFDIANYYNLLKEIEVDVISMIGVLEHIVNPIKALEAIVSNKNVKYFYFSVPLFSLSAILQTIFPNAMERQLAATHTHLFTKNSLDFLCTNYNFEIVSEWWFGTDFADLYRGILVNSSLNNDYKVSNECLDKLLLPFVDELQLVLDKNYLCSEVHLLLKKRN